MLKPHSNMPSRRRRWKPLKRPISSKYTVVCVTSEISRVRLNGKADEGLVSGEDRKPDIRNIFLKVAFNVFFSWSYYCTGNYCCSIQHSNMPSQWRQQKPLKCPISSKYFPVCIASKLSCVRLEGKADEELVSGEGTKPDILRCTTHFPKSGRALINHCCTAPWPT